MSPDLKRLLRSAHHPEPTKSSSYCWPLSQVGGYGSKHAYWIYDVMIHILSIYYDSYHHNRAISAASALGGFHAHRCVRIDSPGKYDCTNLIQCIAPPAHILLVTFLHLYFLYLSSAGLHEQLEREVGVGGPLRSQVIISYQITDTNPS